MCCFSKPVSFVGSTRIFARFLNRVSQCVVYEMTVEAGEDLAMILPIPVARPTKDDAVVFIDLGGYPDFFAALARAFPETDPFAGGPATRSNLGGGPKLAVQRVGAFDASFVPTVADFPRLDPRFRLDDSVWKSLPQYADFGFAVFKLRKGKQKVHPMAFTPPSATPGRISFLTVRIHDGKVHEKEEFDHTLYAQGWTNALIQGPEWEESKGTAGRFIMLARAKELVWGGGHLYKRNIKGINKNEDIIATGRRI